MKTRTPRRLPHPTTLAQAERLAPRPPIHKIADALENAHRDGYRHALTDLEGAILGGTEPFRWLATALARQGGGGGESGTVTP